MNELRGASVGGGPSAIIEMSESRSPKSPRTTTVTPFTTRNGSYNNKSNSPRSSNINNQEYTNGVPGPRRQRSILVNTNNNDDDNNNHAEAEIQFSPPYATGDNYKRVNNLNDSNPEIAFRNERARSNHSRHEQHNHLDSREGAQPELSAGQDVVEEAIILRRRSTSKGRKVDRVKSSEEILSIQRNSLGTGRKKHSSHHSGTSNTSGDSNSKRQERKIFSLDHVYIPSANDSNSKIKSNSDRGSGRRLGDSHNHNSYNSSQDLACVTSNGNDNDAGVGSQNNSKNHNSYTDIDFVRPDIVPLSTPDGYNNRNSSPQSPIQRQQHSNQENLVISTAKVVTPQSTTSTEKLSQPHSPKRVLPKHHHQVFPSGGGSNTAGGPSFVNRNVLTSQRKKREKNRLTQYTNTATTVTSSTSNNNNSANATNGSFISNSTTTNESFKTLRGPPTAPLPTDIPARAIIGKEANSKSKISPQTYLDTLIRSRGYPSPAQSKHNNTGYNTQQPNSSNNHSGVNHATIARRHRTEFDQASFGFFTVGVARLGDCETLQTLLAAGLSPNACNENGESLARIVCRRGDFKSLQMLLKYGCDVDTICDDYGRNLLHDVCCCLSISSCLATVKVILDHCNHTKPSKALSIFSSDVGSYDIHSSALRLFFKSDNSGALPLSYVRQEHWGHWLQFLAFKKDEYLPESSSSTTPTSKTTISTPAASSYNSSKYQHEAVTPVQPLPVEVARMVASGKLPPEQARRLARNLYGKQQNQNKGNKEDGSDKNKPKTKNTANNNSVIISNMSSNSPKGGSKMGDGDASSKGATTLKTIPVPKDQESKFRDIIFYVENTVIRKREKRISRKPDYNIHYDNDVDSTAYPDSVSGVEFYCDSYHYKRHDDDDDLLSTSTESASGGEEVGTSSPQSDQSNRKGTIRYIAPADDVDSTAYPDSVSGVEFYSEPYIPQYSCGYYDNGYGYVQDNNQADFNTDTYDLDITAFPDSVSGVEFYSDTMPQRYEKYNQSRIRSETNNPRANGSRGQSHDYPINLQTNYQPNRSDRSNENRHEQYNDETRRQSYVNNNHQERSNESRGYSSGGNERNESMRQQHYQSIEKQHDRHYVDSPGQSYDQHTSNYDATESSNRRHDDHYENENKYASEGHYYEQPYETRDRQTEIYHERLKDYDDDEQHSPLSPTSFLAASFSTELATTCSVNDQSGSLSYIQAQQSNKKKNQQGYKARQKHAQRYIRSMIDEDNSASANSDSERCVGGSSFSSLLEI